MSNDPTIMPLQSVVCRPSGVIWLGIGLQAFIGIGFAFLCNAIPHSTPRQQLDSGYIFIILLLVIAPLLGATAMIYWALHTRIEADASGIRSRGWREQHTFAWDEVTDYYLIPQISEINHCVIKARETRLSLTAGYWGNVKLLQEIVARYATCTPHSGWEILGCRPNETQVIRFSYPKHAIRNEAIFLASLWIAVVAISIFISLGSNDGWMAAIPIFVLMGSIIGMGSIAANSRIRDLRSRVDQRIEATPLGVSWTDGRRTIFVDWKDITQYGVFYGQLMKHPGGYQVKSADEAFDFTFALQDYKLLDHIIRHWAPPQTIIESDLLLHALGGESARWTGGSLGAGDHVFHYRSRYTRALLWPPITFAAVTPFALFIRPFGYDLALVEAALLLWIILAYWKYRKEMVIVSQEGLTEIRIWRSQFIPWSEVTEYKEMKDWGYLKILSRDKKITARSTIVGQAELRSEIEQRAVNSKNQGWGKIISKR